jgi:hypothetical protein
MVRQMKKKKKTGLVGLHLTRKEVKSGTSQEIGILTFVKYIGNEKEI